MLNNLLAGGCLMGYRSHGPKLGLPPRHNAAGDILNVVPGNDAPTDNHKRSNVKQNGIDLLFYSDLNLDVTVQFVRLVYQSNSQQIGVLISPPHNHHVVDLPTNNIGRLFRFNQSSYIVYREFTANNIDCVVARTSGIPTGNEIIVTVGSVNFIGL
jgi:hypothetical protein